MAFAVICNSCQARFLLNDDLLRRKVAGRVVTVRCRQCHATIEVDASEVGTAPQPEPMAPKPATTQLMFKAPRPAPSPPRPDKSTLMGIGAPRPAGASELVALSPGLLGVETAVTPGPTSRHGFPEPPPPPGARAQLEVEDWDMEEGPPTPVRELAGPESVDDFVEELPPSIPPVIEEELPSSTGTPSLKALTHHDQAPNKPRVDDFLANMNAALNGGISEGAPTIDVSTLAEAPSPKNAGPSIDLSDFEFPARGAETLPLFEGDSGGMAALTAPLTSAKPEAEAKPAAETKAAAKPAAPPTRSPGPPPVAPRRAADGSLKPVTADPPALEVQRSEESVRERRNVVAPSPERTVPQATQRRSGLAAPLLLALAAAAAFLIWKRNSAHPTSEPVAQAERAAAPTPPAPELAAPSPAPEPAVAPSAEAVAAAPNDDVTFETTPTKLPGGAGAAAPTPQPKHEAEPKPKAEAAPKPEPAVPAEPAPAPTTPSEPAGPFDRAAAAASLTASAGQASACRKEGDPSGVASVVVTFAPSGRVTSATIGGPPFAGTPTGSCIAAALRKTRVPAFDGDRVTVSKTVVIQ